MRRTIPVVLGLVPAVCLAEQAGSEVLTLGAALAELDRNNPTLEQVQSRVAEADAMVRQAWAGLLPSLVAGAGYTRNSEEARVSVGNVLSGVLPPNVPFTPPPDLVIQPKEQLAAQAQLRVPLVVPSEWFDVMAARQGAEASSAQVEATRLRLHAALSEAAYLAALGEEVVVASERALKASRDQAERAERAVAAGTAAPLSVQQAKTEATRRQSELVKVRSDLERARLAVGVLVGRAVPLKIILAEPPTAVEQTPEALVEEALAKRPELRAQDLLVGAGERQLRAAYWRSAPQLSASLTAFGSDVAYPTGKREGWRATLDLTWPLYDGGFRYGRAKQAEAASQGARAAAAQARLETRQQVENAVRDLAVARERLKLADEQQKLAAEASASAHRGFEAGVVGSIDVLDADERLYQSEVGLAQTRAGLGVAAVALERAVGRLP